MGRGPRPEGTDEPMDWRSLLQEGPTEQVMPWVGGRQLRDRGRTFAIEGRLPAEHGWHRFAVAGSRKTTWKGPADADPDYDQNREVIRGYLVGNRLIPDGASVSTDPLRLVAQTVPLHLVERGLDRFARATAAREPEAPWVFVRTEFPLGPEGEVAMAFADGAANLDHLPGVPPALDLAFRFCARERELVELARKEAERIREEEERRVAARQFGTGVGRRQMAVRDFQTAATAALALSGATYLDHRAAPRRKEVIVLYRFRGQRFECVVDESTLRIVDSGICLVDHATGEKGDTRFTLESLPAVVGQAMDEDRLVVFRHVD